jgi:hypothetical protein
MAYDDQKQEFGRRSAWIVELFLQKCLLEYGVPPCTAAVGVTGAAKCFNTLATCQDTPNFDPSTATPIRFASERIDGLQAPGDTPTFPTVQSVDTAPTRLEPGKGLGIRASVTIQFKDHPSNDIGFDPYLGDPSRPPGDPDLRGSFWGKLLARNKFWEGRRVDILTGYLDADTGAYDAANFIRRTYIIEKIAGPDRQGNISLVAKDPLKLADSDRAQVPEPTEATLDQSMETGGSQVRLAEVDAYLLYTVGDFIRIDDEIMEVDSINAGQNRLNVSRATLPAAYPDTGTVVAEHDEAATVQICKFYDAARADDIIFDLLVNIAGIDPIFIDQVEWAAVFDTLIPSYLFTTLITEPTGVKKLLQELTEHTILLWWDDRAQEIRFDVLRPSAFVAIPTYTDDENITAGSFATVRSSNERISRVFTLFGQRDPTKAIDEKGNFQQTDARVDLDAETPEEYGSSRLMEIFSRWLPVGLAAVANEIGQRMLLEYRNTKIAAMFTLDPKDDEQYTGDFVKIQTRYVQDLDGNPALQQYRIVEVQELLTKAGARYKYLATQTQLNGRVGVYAPDEDPPATPYPDYPAASEAQRLRAFWADEFGNMSNGDIGYVWS